MIWTCDGLNLKAESIIPGTQSMIRTALLSYGTVLNTGTDIMVETDGENTFSYRK